MNPLTADIPTVDLRAWFEGLRRRWWIILASMIVGLVVVFAQDSGLRQEPTGDFVVKRVYESESVLGELTLVKIDLASITPVPSFDNQLVVIQSKYNVDRLRKVADSRAQVSVSRSEPKFTIAETLDEDNNYVSFLSSGTPLYIFECVGEDQASCERLIDVYVSEVSKLRRESIIGGLDGGIKLLAQLVERTSERIADPSLTSGQTVAYQEELASLKTKADALSEIRMAATGRLIPIEESVFRRGKSVSSITPTTYGFGASIGLVLGLILAIQLAMSDRRIRQAWQISRFQDVALVGSTRAASDERQATALAAALRHANTADSGGVIVLALHDSLMAFGQSVLDLVPDISGSVVATSDPTSVDLLVGNGSASLLVLIKAGDSTRDQLLEKIGEFTSGGRKLLGVALID